MSSAKKICFKPYWWAHWQPIPVCIFYIKVFKGVTIPAASRLQGVSAWLHSRSPPWAKIWECQCGGWQLNDVRSRWAEIKGLEDLGLTELFRQFEWSSGDRDSCSFKCFDGNKPTGVTGSHGPTQIPIPSTAHLFLEFLVVPDHDGKGNVHHRLWSTTFIICKSEQ